MILPTGDVFFLICRMTRSSSFTRPQIVVLLVCIGIFALGQFHRASGGVFTPILMDRFALSAASVGGLVSAMFFATIAVQVPFGVALDRIGPRVVLSACILIVACGTAIFAFGANFETALLSRVLIGVGLAAMGAATHVIIARNFDAGDFGYVSGLVVALGGIGGLLGTYPLAFALERMPWGAVFGGMSVFTLFLGSIVFRTVEPQRPQDAPAPGPQSEAGYLALLKQAEFRKILVLGAVTYAPITTITGLWGGPFLQDVASLSAEQAGAVLLLLFAATIAAGYVFGLLDRRAKSRRAVVVLAFMTSGSCMLGLAALDRPVAFTSITLLTMMVFCQQFYIPLGAHMRRSVPDHMLGRASTLLALVSVAAIPAMQIGFGVILDSAARHGFGIEAQYRFAFGGMGLVIVTCGMVYATARHIDDPDKRMVT